jgi:hypothetical protein
MKEHFLLHIQHIHGDFCPTKMKVCDLCVFTMNFNLPLRYVKSFITFLHNVS